MKPKFLDVLKKRRRNSRLPHNWRIQVAQILKNQGVEIDSVGVRDVCAGKYADEDLTKKVYQAVKQLEKRHEKALKTKKCLTTLTKG